MSAFARAFGGGPLTGTKLVRFAFLDEGGISQHEPCAVVGGVFVHGDDQLIPLEQKLEALVRKHIPDEDREDFVFHATNIWSGTKYFSDRNKWPWDRRAAILDDLVQIPRQLEIPVVYDCFRKADHRDSIERQLRERLRAGQAPKPHDFEIAYHSITFASCMLRIEEMMRQIWPKEVAQIVAEDNSDARQSIKDVAHLFKSPQRIKASGLDRVRVLPLQRIRGAPQFAEKRDSRPLQMADVCSFLIRKRYSNHDARSARFYDPLKEWMLVLPHDDGRPEPPPPIKVTVTFGHGMFEPKR